MPKKAHVNFLAVINIQMLELLQMLKNIEYVLDFIEAQQIQ
jgi:hypothetical protein